MFAETGHLLSRLSVATYLQCNVMRLHTCRAQDSTVFLWVPLSPFKTGINTYSFNPSH
jgi:hypothetical protein